MRGNSGLMDWESRLRWSIAIFTYPGFRTKGFYPSFPWVGKDQRTTIDFQSERSHVLNKSMMWSRLKKSDIVSEGGLPLKSWPPGNTETQGSHQHWSCLIKLWDYDPMTSPGFHSKTKCYVQTQNSPSLWQIRWSKRCCIQLPKVSFYNIEDDSSSVNCWTLLLHPTSVLLGFSDYSQWIPQAMVMLEFLIHCFLKFLLNPQWPFLTNSTSLLFVGYLDCAFITHAFICPQGWITVVARKKNTTVSIRKPDRHGGG
jgi:hypothetical protein